jgi:hypothetical protein
MPTVVGADRSYVNQGKDPETALLLSERPNLDWIRLVIDSYGTIADDRKRQISVSGDRLLVHAQAAEVAEHLLPTVVAAVDRANERYAALVQERSDRPAVALEGVHGEEIASAFHTIDVAIAEGSTSPEP